MPFPHIESYKQTDRDPMLPEQVNPGEVWQLLQPSVVTELLSSHYSLGPLTPFPQVAVQALLNWLPFGSSSQT